MGTEYSVSDGRDCSRSGGWLRNKRALMNAVNYPGVVLVGLCLLCVHNYCIIWSIDRGTGVPNLHQNFSSRRSEKERCKERVLEHSRGISCPHAFRKVSDSVALSYLRTNIGHVYSRPQHTVLVISCVMSPNSFSIRLWVFFRSASSPELSVYTICIHFTLTYSHRRFWPTARCQQIYS